MKIIRNSFIILAVLIALPNPPADKSAPPEAAPSNWALMSAASRAYDDVKTFCVRQPAVCDTADYLGKRAEAKAKYGLTLAYEWANSAKPAADQIRTGTMTADPPLKGAVE
jgi:hypothetical protein